MAALDCAGHGLTLTHEPVQLGALADETWQACRHRYWMFETYWLPTATLAGPGEEDGDEAAGEDRRGLVVEVAGPAEGGGPRLAAAGGEAGEEGEGEENDDDDDEGGAGGARAVKCRRRTPG